jgi:outer membrane lipoprotein carrier protein
MRPRTTWAAALAATFALVPVTSGRAAEPTAAEFAQALQRRYDSTKGFTADFVQTYRGGVLNKQLSERGRVAVKKPGKMRWDYTAPEKKLFVSDGVKIYSYIPADRQVTVSDLPAGNEATTPALFLAGKGNLARDFAPSFTELPAGAAPGTRALKLLPKAHQSDYDWLVVLADPATFVLRGLVYGDPQGGTTSFFFQNLQENAVLADKEFEFKPPRGVDVVTGSSTR